MSFFKSMFPQERFDGLQKMDGVLAIIFYILLVCILHLNLFFINNNYNYFNFLLNKGLSRLLLGISMTLPILLIMVIILSIRKQKYHSVGLSKKGLAKSILIGIIIFSIYVSMYILKKGYNNSLIYNIIFFLVCVGFFEEVSFRGFIWPRLVVLFGKNGGTLISGIFFGAAHAIYSNNIYHAILTNVGGGVLYSVLMIYIYTKNGNILAPSFIHAFLDIFPTLF